MSPGFVSEPTINLLYHTGEAHFQTFNLAISNIKELIKRSLAMGLTQLPTYTTLFSKIQNGENWVNDSENTSTGPCAISPL